MVSPIEGTVSDINQALANDPKLALSDPYGEGWLVTVQSPDAKTSFRNLLGGALARWWTEESASRLQRHMPMAMAGALASHRTVEWPSTTYPPRFPTRSGCRWQKSSSCHSSKCATSRPRRRTSLPSKRGPQKHRPPGLPSGRWRFAANKLSKIVILSAAETSRSEVPTESKDPCKFIT